MSKELKEIKVYTHVDSRGRLNYCNELDFINIKRFYEIVHDSPDIIRAFHGHLLEGKYLYVTGGTFQVVTAKIILNRKCTDYELDESSVQHHFLSEHSKSILYIPPEYAHGIKNLTPNAKLTVFSSLTMQDAVKFKDDYRFPYDYFGLETWARRND